MTTTNTPITVSRSRFTTTYEDNEYEIRLATVTYSRHEHRWHAYCYTGPEEHEHTTAERRSQAEETALRHAFKMHAAIDQPENLERLLALAPESEARGEVRKDTAERKVERQLDSQLWLALEALGYDEERGDWWSMTYNAGESWAIKSVIDGHDRYLKITPTGYSVS